MKLLIEGWRKFLKEEELEPEEEEEDELASTEANLAFLALHKDEASRDHAVMMFKMLYDDPEFDLNLLATELDNRLRGGWDRVEKLKADVEAAKDPRWRTKPRPPWFKTSADYQAKFRAHYKEEAAWFSSFAEAIKFINGLIDGKFTNREFRPPMNLYKDSASHQETLHNALKQTAAIWRER